jgi:hypothetical protein
MDAHGQTASQNAGFGALGTWWRFDRYELHDGYVRPSPGAHLQSYDPWAAYWEARSGRGGGAGLTPYESLFELAWFARLRFTDFGGQRALDRDTERALLYWCSQWGLLGILSHETELATLAPRWITRPDEIAANSGPVPLARAYAWGATGWEPKEDLLYQPYDPVLEGVTGQEGAVVQAELWREENAPPHALTRVFGEGSWELRPLGEAWGPYFPDIPDEEQDNFAYPEPLSEDFWGMYAEPAITILNLGVFLLETLRKLNPDYEQGERFLDFAMRTAEGDRRLYSLLAGVQPAVGDMTADLRYRRAWRTKSLLASFAMMAYLDITDDKRILVCDEDQRPFVSGAYQARYCSERCRRRAIKRAYRQRVRERSAKANDPSPDAGMVQTSSMPDDEDTNEGDKTNHG